MLLLFLCFQREKRKKVQEVARLRNCLQEFDNVVKFLEFILSSYVSIMELILKS